MTDVRYLARPAGRIAYDLLDGDGPLVVCVPGMGELRQSYRLLVPLLAAAGHRVATMDIRGHGDSDTTFPAYDDVALAGDILALIEELGEPAFVVGNSMGAGAGVIAAADNPARVRGLALLGPFVREPAGGAAQKLLLRALFLRPWGPTFFNSYYPRWLPGTKPEGYQEHRARVRDNLRRPGHWRTFVRTTRTSHEPARRRLGDVRTASVVVMGADDVDWSDPAAEAAWIGGQLGAEVVMVPGVGHFPQAQAPEVVAAAVSRLVHRVTA
ncbi:alpha/beta hydrolase [Plantactinospora sp. B5E13]|uniref:alpha/beta fold hydrolase n=1 Tax=unclassified Plantactinospora TaxID=2631981 RepID=UPI00325EEE41